MKKRNVQITLDIFMILALPCLMAYSLIGENFHEVLGTVMGCVFIAHNVLNSWYHKNIFRGRYNANRVLMVVTDTAILIDVLLLLFSGVVLSTFVFSFVNFDSAYMTSRMLHLCASYWGFLFMSFHAGLHIPIRHPKFSRSHPELVSGSQGDQSEMPKKVRYDRAVKIILIIIVTLICIFGIYVFIKNNFVQYLFLRTHFVFLDFERPRIFFFIEHISVIILFMTLGIGVKRIL